MPVSKFTVGVMGSGTNKHEELAEQVGQLLSQLNANLLTGAGGGVMTSVSRVYTASPRTSGICIGIVPCSSKNHRQIPKNGYPNPYVELPIYTHLPYSGEKGQDDLSRNHINILSSNAIVALPGSDGTKSEVELAVKYNKPVIGFSSSEMQMDALHPAINMATDIADVKAFLVKQIH